MSNAKSGKIVNYWFCASVLLRSFKMAVIHLKGICGRKLRSPDGIWGMIEVNGRKERRSQGGRKEYRPNVFLHWGRSHKDLLKLHWSFVSARRRYSLYFYLLLLSPQRLLPVLDWVQWWIMVMVRSYRHSKDSSRAMLQEEEGWTMAKH